MPDCPNRVITETPIQAILRYMPVVLLSGRLCAPNVDPHSPELQQRAADINLVSVANKQSRATYTWEQYARALHHGRTLSASERLLFGVTDQQKEMNR